MVSQIYPTELQLNKINSSDTETPFLDLDLSKIYGERDDFNFEIVSFPFLDRDVPRSPSYVWKGIGLIIQIRIMPYA